MHFAEIPLKNLLHRTTRTALAILGLSVAVAAITTLWTVAWGYAASANEFYALRRVDIVVVRAGVSNRLTSNLQMGVADRIRALAGVENADGSLTEMVSLGGSHLLGIPMRGLVPGASALRDLHIREGSIFHDNAKNVVLIGSGLADAIVKRPDQTLEIEGSDFRVIGVFQADNPFDAYSIMAPIADVQQLMGRAGIVSEFQVRVAASARNQGAMSRLCQQIESLTNADGQPLGLKAERTHDFVESASESRLAGAMAWATTAIVGVLSFVGMFNTMLMSVLERTRELGMLRAVGWKPSRIVRMIVGESALMCAIAAIIGTLAAGLLVALMRRLPATSLFVPDRISSAAVAFGVAAAFVAALGGSCYSALRAASVSPIESLRYE